MCSDFALDISHISKKYKMYDSASQRFLDIFSNGRFGKCREFYALRDFSLQIKKGEAVGILGKNGAGKSTLLQILAGIISPSSGAVTVNGNVSALLELGAGFNPEFTGRENIELSATIYGVELTEIKINKIIEFADIGEFIEQPVKVYSSGMFIRLAFAIASQMNPDILIVDEALSVGDLQFQTKCLRLIEKLRDGGCTFIFVSHSPRMVELFCDRAIWLDQGVVRLDGDPKKVVRAYENFMTGGLDIVEDKPPLQNALSTESDINHDGFISITAHKHIEAQEGFIFDSIRVKINDENNPPLLESQGFDLKVEVKYKLKYRPEKPLWALGIFNELNQPVIHFNTDNDNVIFSQKSDCENTGMVTFNAHIPALRPGDYLLAIGLDEGVPGNSIVLMHIYDAFKLTVFQRGTSPQAGYIQLPGCDISDL